jgi:hypothetical protein
MGRKKIFITTNFIRKTTKFKIWQKTPAKHEQIVSQRRYDDGK